MSGRSDEPAAKEALAEARDNARFATVDEHAGLASPDGVEPPVLDLWREELVSFRPMTGLRLPSSSSAGSLRRFPHPPSRLLGLRRRFR